MSLDYTHGCFYTPAKNINPSVGAPDDDGLLPLYLNHLVPTNLCITGTASEIVESLEGCIAAVLKWTNDNPPPPKLPLTEFAVVPDRFAPTHGSDAA